MVAAGTSARAGAPAASSSSGSRGVESLLTTTNSTRPYARGIDSYDAILVGGGQNALVAAIYLAGGWRTLVVEQGDRLGGAVMSAEVTLSCWLAQATATDQKRLLERIIQRFGLPITVFELTSDR